MKGLSGGGLRSAPSPPWMDDVLSSCWSLWGGILNIPPQISHQVVGWSLAVLFTGGAFVPGFIFRRGGRERPGFSIRATGGVSSLEMGMVWRYEGIERKDARRVELVVPPSDLR